MSKQKKIVPRTKQRRKYEDELYSPDRKNNLIAFQIQCSCCKKGWYYFEREFFMTHQENSYHKFFSILEEGLKDIEIMTLNWSGKITDDEQKFIKKDAIESALKFAIDYIKNSQQQYKKSPQLLYTIEEISNYLVEKYQVKTDRRIQRLDRRVSVN